MENLGIIKLIPNWICRTEIDLFKKKEITHITHQFPPPYLSAVRVTNVCYPQDADPSSLPLRVVKAGRNHLNEEITPLLPTGIGERYSQTILY